MLHPARRPVALAAIALAALAGCSKPAPDMLGPTSPSTTLADTLSLSPSDSLAYSSRPVETGLLGDMLMLGGELYEPRDNWWNTRISNAPVDPNSAQIIATIAGYESTGGRLHPDFAPDFGIPYSVVDESTPLVPVQFWIERPI